MARAHGPSWLGLRARPPGALPARRTHAGGRGGGSSLTDASGAAVSVPPPPGRPLQLPRNPSARGVARVAPRGQVSAAMPRPWAPGWPLRSLAVGLASPWSLGGVCSVLGLQESLVPGPVAGRVVRGVGWDAGCAWADCRGMHIVLWTGSQEPGSGK